MGLFDVFKSKPKTKPTSGISVDIHSHFLPGIDDGVKNWDEAVETLTQFSSFGYKKVVTSPHIMSDFYRNEPATIQSLTNELNVILKEKAIPITVECAAEYYLDEGFLEKIKNKVPLLTFGDNYLLFETSYINKPSQLNNTIFDLLSAGYKPVLVHPERYQYFNSFEEILEVKNRGVFLQVNINSFTGYYSGQSKKWAEMLVDNAMVSFLGSDSHGLRHIPIMEQAFTTKYYQKALSLPLLNYSLV